jgi:hypothetical protein
MSSSNKAGITIGVVVGAVVIAGGISVWVFRKWKLSVSLLPSFYYTTFLYIAVGESCLKTKSLSYIFLPI